MRKLIFQILFIVSIFCTSKAQTTEAFVYSQNKYNTDVWIEKVIIGNGKTEVKMKIKPVDSDIEIYLHPPQSEQSIILKTFEKTYQLLNADSIPFYPNTAKVSLNETKSFSLFYDEIPDDVTEIDIIERVEPFDSGFSFFNVKLSKEKNKKMSLRFGSLSDFQNYFENNPNLHPMEGIWEIDKELITSFKKKNKHPVNEKSKDSVAVVKEDGLLRAYYFSGEDYNLAIKELDNYFVLNSDLVQTSILLELSNNRQSIKIFGLLEKTSIYPDKKVNRKIEDVILRTFWKKSQPPNP